MAARRPTASATVCSGMKEAEIGADEGRSSGLRHQPVAAVMHCPVRARIGGLSTSATDLALAFRASAGRSSSDLDNVPFCPLVTAKGSARDSNGRQAATPHMPADVQAVPAHDDESSPPIAEAKGSMPPDPISDPGPRIRAERSSPASWP